MGRRGHCRESVEFRSAGIETAPALVALERVALADSVSRIRTLKNMIPLEDLEEMFSSMRTETGWDVEGELLWGYYFTDPDEAKLERAAQQLVAAGYDFVLIARADDDSTCVLHVERAEKHTPKTLHARNAELDRLAAKLGLESYDGMDAGPVSDE